MSPTTDDSRDVDTSTKRRSDGERLADLMAPVLARRAFQISLFAVFFVVLTLVLYATRDRLTESPWEELRSMVELAFPLYLIAALVGVVLGVVVAWGAAQRAHKKRGVWAALLAGLSMVLVFVGASWFGG